MVLVSLDCTSLLLEEGWLRHQKNVPVPYRRRRGGQKRNNFESLTTPAAAANVASHHFVWAASTPPLEEGSAEACLHLPLPFTP